MPRTQRPPTPPAVTWPSSWTPSLVSWRHSWSQLHDVRCSLHLAFNEAGSQHHMCATVQAEPQKPFCRTFSPPAIEGTYCGTGVGSLHLQVALTRVRSTMRRGRPWSAWPPSTPGGRRTRWRRPPGQVRKPPTEAMTTTANCSCLNSSYSQEEEDGRSLGTARLC